MNEQQTRPIDFQEGRDVLAEVDEFVRSKPYIAVFGAFAIGVLIAHVFKGPEMTTSRDQSVGEALQDLKAVIGTLGRHLESSAGQASDQFTSALGNVIKKTKRFF